MKILPAGGGKTESILLLALLLLICRNGRAQGDFQNMDFEDSVIVSSHPYGGGAFNVGTADVPGWTEYYGWSDVNYSGGTTLQYNDPTLDAPGVTLFDAVVLGSYAIQGNYSIYLYGGDTPSMTTGAAIGQTGTIPTTAQSLTFDLGQHFGSLQVTFNGQPLDYLVTGSAASYTIYSADISAYAGEAGQLLFTAPYYSNAMLDNIQFSSSPVPEPGVLALTALGTVLLGCRRFRK